MSKNAMTSILKRTSKRRQKPQIVLNLYCSECIKQVKQYNKDHNYIDNDATTTACISYENEPHHAQRMISECPLLKQNLYNIFNDVDAIKKAMGEYAAT